MLVNISQNTPEWHEWRKGKIGSSDAGTIMGLNPFESAYQLWQRRKGLIPEKQMTDKMALGHNLEPEVRQWASQELKKEYNAACFQHDFLPLIASLDGYNEETNSVIEIKVSQYCYDQAIKQKIPPKYFAQIQHQLFISKCEKAFYIAYNGFDGLIIEVDKDEEFKDKMLKAELEFYELLQGDVPPPLSEMDFLTLEVDNHKKNSIYAWKMVQEKIKDLEKEEKSLREEILSLGKEGNCLLSYDGEPLLKMTKVKRDSSVDWKALCKSYSISDEDLSKFRKEQISYYQLKSI